MKKIHAMCAQTIADIVEVKSQLQAWKNRKLYIQPCSGMKDE